MILRIKNLCVPRFSTANNKAAHKLTDWQYVQLVHDSLKKKNINSALSYLINSSLEGTVLDKQTFYNTYNKMKELKTCISYQEVTYKLYRQNFSPCPLIVDWMKMLAITDNPQLKKILIEDFKKMNMPFPQTPPKQNPQNTKKLKNQDTNSQKKNEEKTINHKSQTPQVNPSIQNVNKLKDDKTQKQTSQSQHKPLRRVSRPVKMPSNNITNNADKIQQLNSAKLAQIAGIMQRLEKQIRQKGIKIVLKEIQVQSKEDKQIDQGEQILQGLNQQQLIKLNEKNPQKLLLVLSQIINSIKLTVGKAEIFIEGSKPVQDTVDVKQKDIKDNKEDGKNNNKNDGDDDKNKQK